MHGWYCWYCSSRCAALRCRQAQDALHYCRYGSEVQLCRWLVGLLVTLHLPLCFFPDVMPKMFRILAGTFQKVCFPRRTGKLEYLGDDYVDF